MVKKTQDVGLSSIDNLPSIPEPVLQDYLTAVSQYVREHRNLSKGAKKAAQIRLSSALDRILLRELTTRLANLRYGHAGEKEVSGALRVAQADVSEIHPLDGLRLAVEIKPVNLAVGRAIWNRFGDIRTFAVNLHLKFPFAVIGGVLILPTYEEENGVRRPTSGLVIRAVERLNRAGGRRTESDAAHLLESIGVVVYDPDSMTLDPAMPPVGSGLRCNEFVDGMVVAYRARFEE